MAGKLSAKDASESLEAVREFVLNQHTVTGDKFYGACNVVVGDLLYANVYVAMYYQIDTKDFRVSIMWEEDSSQPDFRSINLHGSYSSNFQLFSFNESTNTLAFEDGLHKISIHP